MNRFQSKYKQKENLNNHTEDSSDYVNSDAEFTSSNKYQKVDIDSNQNQTSNNHNLEDSNDSYFNDRDDSNAGFNKNFNSQNNKNNADKSRLMECLNYLHSLVCRKDKEAIFEFPVTDDIAPGYSLIIKHPMDLSKMKSKIDSYEYNTVTEYRDDLILMCENCMTYNKMDTIYYHAARKMLDYGLKLLSRDKLSSLRHTVRVMRYLTPNELGFSLDGSSEASSTTMFHDVSSKHKSSHSTTSLTPTSSHLNNKNLQSNSTYTSRLGHNNSIIISKAKILQKIDAIQQQQHNYNPYQQKDSYLVPPEGLDTNDDEQEDIDEEVRELANEASARLASKNQNGKMGFLRRNSNGTTGYNFLKNNGDEEMKDKSVTIGTLCEGLQQSSYSMNSFIEDKKNKSKPMYFIENGPFSTHAPQYDTSYTNLTKEDTDLLLLTYGDEISYQYALSFMDFAKSTTQMYNKYVNLMLNSLTSNEHEKYLTILKNKEKEKEEKQTNNIAENNASNIPTSSDSTVSNKKGEPDDKPNLAAVSATNDEGGNENMQSNRLANEFKSFNEEKSTNEDKNSNEEIVSDSKCFINQLESSEDRPIINATSSISNNIISSN